MFRTLTTRQLVVDLVLAAVAFLLFSVISLLQGVAGVGILLLYTAAIAVRRWSPGLSLGIAWSASLVQMAGGLDPNPMNLLVLPVLYATAAYGSTLVRWLGFASAFVAAAAIGVYLSILPLVFDWPRAGAESPLGALASGAFFFGAALAGFLLSWTAGLLRRTWGTATASRQAAQRAERDVVAEQERTRIARDMHDVVAHSLAVVIAQADGARYLRQTDPEAVDQALSAIASTSRRALADVRVLLAQLRHSQGDAPQPVLADLDALFEQLRSSGLDVRQESAGQAIELGTSTQLAVYRIVQESLTNALRHGDTGRPVTVRFDWAPGGLHLSIASAVGPEPKRQLGTATGALQLPPTSGGHGIAGMSERALIVGGSLTARADGDRFIVRAWLPATDHPIQERMPV
jgi:signal transduction histidine kinase